MGHTPPPVSSHCRETSSASDFLVERQLQKCHMCVTFSVFLHRSLEWSPLHRERKARPLSFHRAGRATCPLRAGATMSTRPPMVSPALGSVLRQPRGPVRLEGWFSPPSFTSWALDFSSQNLPQKLQGNLAFFTGLGGRGLSLGGESCPSKLGSSLEPHNHPASLWNPASWSGAVFSKLRSPEGLRSTAGLNQIKQVTLLHDFLELGMR